MQIQPFGVVEKTTQAPNVINRQDESGSSGARSKEVEKAFQDFVGQTFFGQMLSAMRKTVGKPAYFHGGRAEEIFQGQLDQILSEKLSEATAHTLAGPMYELFSLPRR